MRNASRNDLEQLGRGAHQEIVLGDRHGEPVGVDLLEGVGADHAAGHLAGDRDERNRVQFCVGDRGQQVGRAGSRGAEADRRAPGGARHALRDEARALLVARQHVANRAALQRVVQRQVAPPGMPAIVVTPWRSRSAVMSWEPVSFMGAFLSSICSLRSCGGGRRVKKQNPRRPSRPAGVFKIVDAFPLGRDGAVDQGYYYDDEA